MRLLVLAISLTLTLPLAVHAQGIESLRSDLESVRTEIEAAEQKNSQLAGGLVKSLVEARIEILKTTEALIQQRIHAIESDSPISIQIPSTAPDPDRAANLEKELVAEQQQLTEAKAEATRYTGGLVAAMKSANVATIEQTISMLEQAYLRNKYGLALPALGEGTPSETPDRGSASEKHENPARQLVLPQISNKRYAEQKYDEFIFFDVEWVGVNLRKPARSIKGLLLFQDLFGETKFAINVTIDEPLDPGGRVVNKGIGFEYNQFRDPHRWVRTTDLDDMLIELQVKSVLYADGEREDF